MAKKFGLGGGLDAVFASEGLSQKDAMNISNDINSFSKTESSTSKSASNKKTKTTTANLPNGITTDENGTLWVDPTLLKPNPHQPRQFFDDAQLKELSESIKQDGVISPIIIEDAKDGTFYIIAGERRTRASILAGLKKVPVQLGKYSDIKKLQVALIENIQRTDLNPVEEAQAYYKLMEIGNLTQDQVAERVGKNRSTVANCLRLLKLSSDMQNALVKGTITPGHARAILSLDKQSDQETLFKKIIQQGISVRDAETFAKEIKDNKHKIKKTNAKIKDTRDPNYIALEQTLIETLGTKVQLKGNFDKGDITISYFSKDDLDRIYNIISK